MIRIGVAPRIIDIVRGAVQTVDTWFNTVSDRFNLTRRSTAPVVSEVPTNQWGFFKNTTTGDVNLIVNDNGVLKNVTFTSSGVGPLYRRQFMLMGA